MIKRISIKDITQATQNYRLTDQQKDVSGLMSSIKETGLIHPITVKKTSNGYKVVAGFRRLEAMKKLKKTHIQANIVPIDANETAINLAENVQRKDTTSFEIGRGMADLVDNQQYTIAEVAALTGCSVAKVKSYITLFENIPSEYRLYVKNATLQKSGTDKNTISNGVALKILSAKQSGKINAKQTKNLFAKAKQSNLITNNNVGEYIKSEIDNKGKKVVKVKTVTLRFNVSYDDYEKIGYRANYKMKKELEKKFGFKII
jgi:ParB family chromosome partitioning protein